jgi:hypothetical protein
MASSEYEGPSDNAGKQPEPNVGLLVLLSGAIFIVGCLCLTIPTGMARFWVMLIVLGLMIEGIIITLTIFIGGLTLVIWSAIKIWKYVKTISRVDSGAGRDK